MELQKPKNLRISFHFQPEQKEKKKKEQEQRRERLSNFRNVNQIKSVVVGFSSVARERELKEG